MTEPLAAPARLILWDIDGTLLNPAGFGRRVMHTAFERTFDLPAPTGISFAGRTDRAILREFIERGAPAEAHRQDELHRAAVAIAERERATLLAEGGSALPGALGAVEALARRPDLVQTVLTGNLREIGLIKLAEIGADRHLALDLAAWGDHHPVRADLVAAARDLAEARYRTPFRGPAVLVVGDTPLDIEAAAAHGARCIAVCTGSHPAADLTAADLVLPDLRDLPRFLEAVTTV
ncbi:HAD family hydrolase [Nocardia takedensis]